MSVSEQPPNAATASVRSLDAYFPGRNSLQPGVKQSSGELASLDWVG